MSTPTVFPDGFLIAFDGIDGTGKTTQVVRLTNSLVKHGFEVVRSKEPTDGPWGKLIRESARGTRLGPEEELNVLLKDRREHVQNFIKPSLASGKIVILDRYFWSNVAYQGCTLGDPHAILKENLSFAPCPDLTILLDAPVPVCQGRIVARDGAVNAFEKAEFLACCQKVFRSIDLPGVRHVDGSRTPDEVEQSIRAAFLVQAAPLVDHALGMTGDATGFLLRLWGDEKIPAGWHPASA
jgi:dTMP kinase